MRGLRVGGEPAIVNREQAPIDDAEFCLRCELCDAVCPTGLAPSAISDAKRRGENHGNATLCTNCGRCRLACPAGVAPDFMAQAMKGTVDSEEYDRIRENVRRFGFVVEPEFEKSEPGPRKRKAEVAYFNGCLATHRIPEHARAAKELLQLMGVEFTEIEENCCGSPLRRLGEYELADEMLSKNVERFRELGVKVVVTSCPGCATTIMEGAPDLEVYHLLEYLDEHGLSAGLERSGETLSYHLPCHLYRNINPLTRKMTEAWLEKVGEVRRLEHAADCCGAGGLVHLQHPGGSAECAAPLAREFAESGARRLVTLCPSCYLQFRRLGLPAVDLAVLLRECAGVR